MPPIPHYRTYEERRAMAERMYGSEWAEWVFMSQAERLAASDKMMAGYLALGGHLDPEVDLQSPFWTMEDYREFARARKEKREQEEREALNFSS